MDYSLNALFQLLPFPSEDMHKYSRGKLLIVGGSAAYPGAAGLAALAGQRMGAGYTEVFADKPSVGVVQQFAPSLVVRAWDAWGTGAQPALLPGRPLACVVGCGLDAEDAQTAGLVRQVLAEVAAPVLVDAGALGVLSSAQSMALLKQRAQKEHTTVITPHGGEASQLAASLNISEGASEELAAALAQACYAVCVLKGANTYISDGKETYCMDEGGPALAKAGTGDVLAGVVGALLAQGLGAFDACVLGTTLHARAANQAAEDLSSISVTPEDVVAYLPRAICSLSHTD